MTQTMLPFEEPLAALRSQVASLRALSAEEPEWNAPLAELEARLDALTHEVYGALSAWEKVLLCRHPQRPTTMDYIAGLFDEFIELHGDRAFADDRAIVTGLGRFGGRSIVVAGHRKGRNARENAERHFGMAHPEGYRKAARLFDLADRFCLPILTLIDTPGAYPGIGAEERGQSEAIAECIATLTRVRVPVVCVIVGEGGSGGALALALANRVLMQTYATYSVISPEGCASILWRNAKLAPRAAEQLRLTAPELVRLGIVDGIVDETISGAHIERARALQLLREAIENALGALADISDLRAHRYGRFRALGAFSTRVPSSAVQK